MAIFMAKRCCYLIPLMACLVLHTMQAAAVTHIVGDDKGWALGVNYTAWAEGKQFNVGDVLVFNYTQGKHNVHQVDGVGFKNCTKDSNLRSFNSGYDQIELTTGPRNWFICAVSEHCEGGMKFVIAVGAAEAPAPQPKESSNAPASHYIRFLSVSVAFAMTFWLVVGRMFL